MTVITVITVYSSGLSLCKQGHQRNSRQFNARTVRPLKRGANCFCMWQTVNKYPLLTSNLSSAFCECLVRICCHNLWSTGFQLLYYNVSSQLYYLFNFSSFPFRNLKGSLETARIKDTDWLYVMSKLWKHGSIDYSLGSRKVNFSYYHLHLRLLFISHFTPYMFAFRFMLVFVSVSSSAVPVPAVLHGLVWCCTSESLQDSGFYGRSGVIINPHLIYRASDRSQQDKNVYSASAHAGARLR